ncbi:MAG: alpha/beta hydrolase [Leptolyngbyaceae bacterium]|nr:alpha/beta hydrolase [Leptolyngbyaceae bacterium]
MSIPLTRCFQPAFLTAARRFMQATLAGFFTGLTTALPAFSADQISFYYSIFERSIEISTLEEFAEEGRINSQLRRYFSLADVSPSEQRAFRAALQESADVDPVLLSRFFYSNIGEDILEKFLGDLIRTESGLNGIYSLRSALILAAQDDDGLSVLNFLRHLPTDMQINLRSVLAASETVESAVQATQFAIDTLTTLSNQEALNERPVMFDNMRRLNQRGGYGVQFERWELTSERRNWVEGTIYQREFNVDVFYPQQWRAGKTPVIVFSHGLASGPEYYDEWAKLMASYGFVVALPQHPGSDVEQRDRFLNGFSSKIFSVNEFIDRPQDISDVIDELERRNQTDFDGQLDLTNVGVGGHSFGGYTAFAVAGATINFDFLAAECSDRFSTVNTSLLLQCQALDLPRRDYSFRDERVQAISVMNPVNSSIFGREGLSRIQIPVNVVAGSFDPATPVIFEQFRTFPWIESEEKYLGLIEGQAHVDFSEIDAGITDTINSVSGLTLPDPKVIDVYENSISVAFFEVYTAEDERYRPYLQAAYSDFLSRDQEFDLHLISDEMEAELEAAIEAFETKSDVI